MKNAKTARRDMLINMPVSNWILGILLFLDILIHAYLSDGFSFLYRDNILIMSSLNSSSELCDLIT